MSDIELVIKISEEDFERCKKRFQRRIDIMGDAIANGTPLPKGHGRLIDGDKFEKSYTLIDDWPGNTKRVLNILAEVPTIIEVDKAESEE